MPIIQVLYNYIEPSLLNPLPDFNVHTIVYICKVHSWKYLDKGLIEYKPARFGGNSFRIWFTKPRKMKLQVTLKFSFSP